ncbi:MAG: SDR family oxidoreductase [Aquincola sp.]|uniref:SDR family oxidoreductase n=1 Tax=uncultured Aquincola sp. TaxID=886556 RepID=UPI0032B1A154|nr:SDR family oxidoreductase [Aquincola sp.]
MKVLVIGASRGLGQELVRQCLADRAQVTATARGTEGVAALQAMGAEAFALDVSDAASASGIAWRCDNAGFDQVWLMAGVYGPRTQALQTPTEADFDAVMHTNVLGAMRVLPQLADALAPGAKVAVLSSRMGSIGLRSATAGWLYRASKAALNSVVKDVSLAWQDRAVCVALHPGWVQTDMGGSQADLTPQQSIADLRRTVAGLTPQHSGGFFNHDGQPLVW